MQKIQINKKQIIKKPWGREEIIIYTDKYVAKYLIIKKGSRLSYQYHKKKDESLLVLEGSPVFSIEDEDKQIKEIKLKKGEFIRIPPKTKHRISALDNCKLLEVSTPQLDDVVRLEDDYKRIS